MDRHIRFPFRRSFPSRALLAVLALLAGAGCGTQSVQVKVLRPAAADFGTFAAIAVDDFDGDGGTQMRDELMAALVGAKNPAQGNKNLTVVDNERLDTILKILERERADLWDQETVSRLGQFIGVSVLIHGRVSNHAVKEDVTDQQLGTSDGQPIILRTRSAVAEVSCSITASDTSTGRIIDKVTLSGRAEDSTSQLGGDPAPLDHNALLRDARSQITEAYLRRVLPHEELVDIDLYVESDFPQLALGNQYAQTGAWDRAIEAYREALDRMTGENAALRWKALYNLGVALTYASKFDEARQALEEAHAASQANVVLQALTALDEREREYEKLRAHLEGDDAA